MPLWRIALCSVKGIIKIVEYEKEVTGNWYIDLTDAVANKLLELKAYWWCTQASTPTPSTPVDIVCNNWTLKIKDKELPIWYVRIESIDFDGSTYYDTNEKLYGSDTISMKLDQSWSVWRNIFGAYTSAWSINYSFYWYNTATWQAYLRYGDTLYRPTIWTGIRTLKFWPWTTTWFATNVTITADTFESADTAYIGALPNSSSPKYEWEFIWNVEVTSGGTTRLKWIPCKRKSDGVIWYYEVVNWNFLEPSGTGTPVAWAEDYSNIEVYVDGTKEKVWYSGWATATCEDLLWVWDYKDEQEILSGNVITNVGVMVLTGNEDWNLAGSGDALRVDIRTDIWLPSTQDLTSPMMCTHYPFDAYFSTGGSTQPGTFNAWNWEQSYFLRFSIVGMNITTVNQWKSWLATQATAWTPVIVVYPLATPTTLSVAWQSLSIPAWNSRIQIVEWSILNLPLYAKYKSTSE